MISNLPDSPDYAITEQQIIAREMKELENKLNKHKEKIPFDFLDRIEKLEIEFNLLKKNIESKSSFNTKCREFEKMLEDLKESF